MRMDLEHIISAVDGMLLAGTIDCDRLLSGITWDSREVPQDSLYIALVGERVDGHDYALAAVRAGAAAALVTHPLSDDDTAQIVQAGAAVVLVDDEIKALSALAGTWRSDYFEGTIVGLTGSTGKTTTKNIVSAVLGAEHTVSATRANWNNELGVPRTLLDASAQDDFVVVEMGMRGAGQLTELCSFVKPDWGIITNVGECHIELLGSREAIVLAKRELFEALPEGGIAFVNAGDDNAVVLSDPAILGERGVRTVFFQGSGAQKHADELAIFETPFPFVWADSITLDDFGHASFVMHAAGFSAVGRPDADGSCACTLKLQGLHNVDNACCAAAVGIMAGMSIQACCRALEACEPASGRQQLEHTANGALLVNDAYNANPDSMKASLSTFAAMKVAGRHIAVLGDMAELGDFAGECHARVGAFAGKQGFEQLVFVGEFAETMASAALDAGAPAESIVCFANTEGLRDLLESEIAPDDAVLLKASHFMGFEIIAEGLVG